MRPHRGGIREAAGAHGRAGQPDPRGPGAARPDRRRASRRAHRSRTSWRTSAGSSASAAWSCGAADERLIAAAPSSQASSAALDPARPSTLVAANTRVHTLGRTGFRFPEGGGRLPLQSREPLVLDLWEGNTEGLTLDERRALAVAALMIALAEPPPAPSRPAPILSPLATPRGPGSASPSRSGFPCQGAVSRGGAVFTGLDRSAADSLARLDARSGYRAPHATHGPRLPGRVRSGAASSRPAARRYGPPRGWVGHVDARARRAAGDPARAPVPCSSRPHRGAGLPRRQPRLPPAELGERPDPGRLVDRARAGGHARRTSSTSGSGRTSRPSRQQRTRAPAPHAPAGRAEAHRGAAHRHPRPRQPHGADHRVHRARRRGRPGLLGGHRTDGAPLGSRARPGQRAGDHRGDVLPESPRRGSRSCPVT